MDDSSGRGTGIGSSFAAVHRALRSPEEQPRLPLSSGSRDLFPLVWDPHRALSPKGFAQRVEPLRRYLVDDALSALNWLSGKRQPAPFARNQMQDACVARVDTLSCSMLGDVSTVGVPTSAEALTKVLRGLDACDSGAGSSTSASLSTPKLSLPVVATGACCLLSVLPDSAGRYFREPERMVNDAMHCAQVMSTAPEPYFDPMLVHRRRTSLELVRLLALRGVVRFTLEPKEKVCLFAVRKDDGLKQRLVVDAWRSNLRFRPCPNVSLLSSEGFSKLEVDPDVMPGAWFGITDTKDCFHNMLIPEWLSGFFSLIPVTAKEGRYRRQHSAAEWLQSRARK